MDSLFGQLCKYHAKIFDLRVAARNDIIAFIPAAALLSGDHSMALAATD
jgi:hypothetical protein